MADGDPDDDLNLDPPEDEAEQTEEQDETQVDGEQEDESTEDEVDAQAEDQQQDQPEQRQPSRGERRQQRLSNALRERDERIADLNRRLDQVLLAQPRQQQGETPEQRAQRHSLLTPEERITETLREDREVHARDMRQLQFSIQDGNDRSAFEAKATVDPLYEKWRPKVEAELTALRAKGQTVGREQLMFYLIGQNAVQARKAAGKVQRQQGARRVERQRTGAPNGRSDTQATRRQQGNSLERRLENVQI